MATTMRHSVKELAAKPILLPLPELPQIKLQRFAYMSWWVPVFFGLAAFNVFIMTMVWFVLTARSGSYLASLSNYLFSVAGDLTAGSMCGLIISTAMWVNTIIVILAALVLFRRLRMQVSLFEVITVIVALGYVVGPMSESSPKTLTTEVAGPIVLHTYGVLSAALLSVFLMHIAGCRLNSIRSVSMGLALLCGIYAPAGIFLVPQALLAVAACVGTPREYFPKRGDGDQRRLRPTT